MLTITSKEDLENSGDSDIIIECPDGSVIIVRAKEVRKHQVRIGIHAPRDYKVHRRAIVDKRIAEGEIELPDYYVGEDEKRRNGTLRTRRRVRGGKRVVEMEPEFTPPVIIKRGKGEVK